MELQESLNYCLLSVPQLIGFRVTLAVFNRFPLLGRNSWKRDSPFVLSEGRGLQPRLRGGLHASKTGPRACAVPPTHLSGQNILGQGCPRGPHLPGPSWHKATHLYQRVACPAAQPGLGVRRQRPTPWLRRNLSQAFP